MSIHRLVIGNWKMNPDTLLEARRLARQTRTAAAKLKLSEVVICPPFPFLMVASGRQSGPNFAFGAQSVSIAEGGAHTGEVSAAMLRSLGASFVIVGHSEERARGITDETVSQAALRASAAGLTAVVCVGEKTRTESGEHFAFLKNQIEHSLAGLDAGALKHIILAYEPIWAIGAKEAMAPEAVGETALFIKKVLADHFGPLESAKVKILYGGSVNFRNAADIMRLGRVDGLLVGRESVNWPGFSALLKAVDEVVIA